MDLEMLTRKPLDVTIKMSRTQILKRKHSTNAFTRAHNSSKGMKTTRRQLASLGSGLPESSFFDTLSCVS